MSGTFRKGHNTTRSSRGTPTLNVDQAVGEANNNDHTVYSTTLAGDARKLRGIPAIGRSVAGAIPGTSPHSIRVIVRGKGEDWTPTNTPWYGDH